MEIDIAHIMAKDSTKTADLTQKDPINMFWGKWYEDMFAKGNAE